MVECSASELSEDIVIDALELAHNEIKRLIALQHEIVAELQARGLDDVRHLCV